MLELFETLTNTPPRQLYHRLYRKMFGGAKLSAFDDAHPCVFVLSTGRAGTETLASLFSIAESVFAYHEPSPLLYGLSKLAYETQGDESAGTVFREAFYLSRRELLDYSLDCGKGYVETSPQVTFLARSILDVLPSARFIHVVRDPRDVVRSGMRRKWYAGHLNDATRIVPNPSSPAGKRWLSFNSFEKNLWLWAETNRWIMEFTRILPSGRFLTVRSEDVFAGQQKTIASLFELVGSHSPAPSTLQRVLRKKLNAQRTGEFPVSDQWTDEMKRSFKEIAGDVAAQLGYSV